MAIARSATKRRRRAEALKTRARNEVVKLKERARRDARLLQKVKSETLPYSPAVMSWLSRKLDKKASRITSKDVSRLST